MPRLNFSVIGRLLPRSFGEWRRRGAADEIQVTELLNEKTPDRDYGDIDVLAWKPGQDDILAIECKDLKLTKTPNEIAEQLNHFSGQILPNGKRDELRKHLDRCAFLNEKA